MRVISAELKTAQESSSRIPYVELVFHSNETPDYVDYGDRCLGGEHHEEPFNGYATILLRNNDNSVQDLRGYWIEIGYGDKLTPGTRPREAETTARLWVISQTDISFPGTKITTLELKDGWEILKKPVLEPYNLEAPFHFHRWTNATVWQIVATLLLGAGFQLEDLVGTPTFDPAFVEFIPEFTINEEATIPTSYISYKDAILTLLNMTSTYLRPKRGKAFEAVFPKEDDPVDVTYYSYQTPWFKEFDYRRNVVVPNHIFVYCDFTGGVWNPPFLVGIARDKVLPAYLDVDSMHSFYIAGDVRTQADADRRAQAILDRIRIQSRGGRLIIPHDCRVELFDMVKVVDTR